MQNKKWLSILLALVVSVGLWVYVVTVENPEGERTFSNIPVTFLGEDLLREDHDLIITQNNVPTGVSLTFSGKLADLNKLTENKADMMVNIDVSSLRKAQEYPFFFDIYDVTLPASVSVQDVTMNYRSPSQVTLTLEKLAKRSVPVKVLTEVDIKEGFTADRLTQNYEEIMIEGPEVAVNQVDYAQVILKRENADQTITSTLTYQLIDKNGDVVENQEITSEVTEIEVTLPILMYKDVPLEIPVINGGGATASDAVIDIFPETVRLSADPTVLEGIETIKLSALDLSSLMTNNELVTRVISIPEECTNISGEQTASVSVQIKNKSIRQMHISSNHFSFVGVPSTLQPVARTSILPITIRANDEDIDKILEDNVRVVADFSNVILTDTVSSMTLPVKIYIDGFEGAGVVAETEYTIVVDLTPVAG